MAQRRSRIMGTGKPIITAFSFDENLLDGKVLNVKLFNEPTKDWADFILRNRHSSKNNFHHDFDIVIGPIADDGVAFQLARYEQGMITLETLAEELKYKKKLSRQYYFGTERAIQHLIRL